MFGRRKVEEAYVKVDHVRTVTGNRIVSLNPGRRDGFNLSSSMQIHKAYFICEDDTILELQVKKKQMDQMRNGMHGTVQFRKGKMLKFIPD